jgi:[ribosomal protein S5]-alanine N-acetyltransferase
MASSVPAPPGGKLITVLPYPDPPLEDGVVRLRRWERRDLPCVEAASADPRIPQGTTVPAVFSDAEGIAYIERQWRRQSEDEGLPPAIERTESGLAVGFIVLLYRREPDVLGLGYWVIPEARSHRYARRAVSLLVPWALRLGTVNRVEAMVEPDNVASRRTVEGAGFQREGLLRSYLHGTHDVFVYSLVRADITP